ncbi:hypothetical protein GCM10023189_15270 [Nibrella saemangeumensis]|uniref:RloB-like protein n=1 Tax=Nibrella saemangeumensis TaxID=1084526 RepID=A0ABP8MLE9_9BACT
MRKLFTYGFFGEDAAQQNFLSKYLDHHYPNTFIEDEEFRWRIKVRNRDQVDALLPQALLQKVKLNLDVLFVGRDMDSAHEPSILAKRDYFSKICKGDGSVFIMLPVQCIEHWLWYLKRRQEEPGKNTPLESLNRRDAKRAVYGNSQVTETQLEKANQILLSLDVKWLESRSESFRHFHQQVGRFVETH